ncbi:MAG: hypothetical protein NC221_02920 [Duncaniella sp.]|nr:hypothetical protein [Muribaculum sp.]MCM1255052.1 hypothetical protein [Duncaniella sp.]
MYSDFPTDDWTNLNWWNLVNRAQVINLGKFPQDYQSPMRPMDTWHHNRKLGMVVEARVLGGKLFMTTFDFDRDLENRPVARQMRKSILNYLNSDCFNPIMEVNPNLISRLLLKRLNLSRPTPTKSRMSSSLY